MFGIGFPELIIILVVALIVFGPKKLPELAKALGKGMAEFKKATHEIKESLELNEDLQSVRKDLTDSVSGLDRVEQSEAPPVVEKPGEESAVEKLGEESAKLEAVQETTEPESVQETAKFEGYDEVIESYEKLKTEESRKLEEKKKDPAVEAKNDHAA